MLADRTRALLAGLLAWTALGCGTALAQLPPAGSPLPYVTPPPSPNVAPPVAPAPAPRPAPMPAVGVTVRSVAIEGATAYSRQEIEAVAHTSALVGTAVPLARIEAARTAILQLYRGDGYVLSAVSVSVDAKGALRFLVTEGRIAAVKLSADIGPAGTRVLKFLRHLTEKTPIDEATLERYLLLAQQVPGVTLHAVLQPVPGEPGAVNLIAEVSRAAISGLATTDNYGASFAGPIETLAVFDLNSFTSLGEKTEISLYHTWANSETFGQATSEVFLGDSGLRLHVYGGDGQTTPTGPLSAEGYIGTTTVFGLGLTYPLLLSRSQNLTLAGNLDAEDSQVTVLASGVRGPESADSLRILRASADYALSDVLLGASRSAVNTLAVRLSQGITELGASNADSSLLPRTGEDPQFTKVDWRFSRTQTLFAPWPGASVALYGLVAGQFTNNTLPPAEEFYLGGLQYLRGYELGAITGDTALTSTIELQFNTSLDLSALAVPDPVPVQFYGFYDWGEVWQHNPNSYDVRAATTGIGVRLTATTHAEVDFLAAARLNRYPAGGGPNVSALNAGTFLWRVLTRF